MIASTATDFASRYREARKIALVAAGIIAGQVVLYGPALVGTKILLPLGALAEPNKYIPHSPGTPEIESPQAVLSDLVLQAEPVRRFAVKEIASGRFPRWLPHWFGGVPFISWGSYSPLSLFSFLSESPVIIAWAQLLAALAAGFGAFVFCRRVLKLSYWPSALAAWCYPITGWFVLLQGYLSCAPVIGLPWLCYSVDHAIRGTPAAVPRLALCTALVAVSGNPDMAGQVLLVSGLFALWRTWDVYRGHWAQRLVGKGGMTAYQLG